MADEIHPLIVRLRWILEARGMSGRELARKAGTSPQYVNLLIYNYAKKGIAPNIEADSATKIARAANVRTGWLMQGSLPREPFDEKESRWIDFDGRYPNLTEAIAIIKDELLPETIEFLRSKALDADADLSVSEWATDARLWDKAFRRKKKSGEDVGREVDDENIPPRGR